jgi:addiction module HigA family antidote
MMNNPPHPGIILREDVLLPLQLGVREAAERLSISRVSLSRVLNGKAGISPALAIRLEAAGVSTARFWMNLQSNYELALAQAAGIPEVKRLSA